MYTAPNRALRRSGLIAFVLAFSLALLAGESRVCAQSTSSTTYQGVLKENNVPVSGTYDIRFTLYDARQGGVKVAPPLCVDDVRIIDGLFTVVIPLPALTSGTPVFVEVSTRLDNGEDCSGSEGYIELSRRQQITATPIAVAASAVTQRSPSVPGALRYNPTEKRFEGFTGVFWVPLIQGIELTPPNVQYFNCGQPNVFVVPAGVTRIGVNLVGASGGGGTCRALPITGGCNTPTSTAGFGGGSGAAIRAFVDVTPGEALTVTIGAGGAGTTVPGQAGQPGGDTILSRQGIPLLIAGGGKGGKAGILALPDINSSVFDPVCTVEAPFPPGGSGEPGIASAPGAGVTTILMINGRTGRPPRVATCVNGAIPDLGCGGFGGAGVSLPEPLGNNTPSGGNGGPLASSNPGPAFSGGSGGASIWWD
jgi:hypothetical protein